MAFERPLSDLKSVLDLVVKVPDDQLMQIAAEQAVNSRARHDDDVTGGDVANLQTLLSDPEKAAKYKIRQRKVNDAPDLWTRRERELKLLFSKPVAEQRIASFWKTEYANNVFRNSQFKTQMGEEGDLSPEDMVSQLKTGGTFDDYQNDADRKKINDARYERLQRGGKSQSTHQYMSQSYGSDGVLLKLHLPEDDPSGAFATDNFISKLVDELRDSPKDSLLVFCAMLAQWKIDLPTFLKAGKVPSEWKKVQKIVDTNPEYENGISSLRNFLEMLGIKSFGNRSPQVPIIQAALLKVAGAENEDELRIIMNEIERTASAGKDKGYDTSVGYFHSGNGADDSRFAGHELNKPLNESMQRTVRTFLIGEALETYDKIEEARKLSAARMKVFNKLDSGIAAGTIQLRVREWEDVIPTLVWTNFKRKTAAFDQAKRLTAARTASLVSKELRNMLAQKPTNGRVQKILIALATEPTVATGK